MPESRGTAAAQRSRVDWARALYTTSLIALLPLVLARLAWRGLRQPAYRRRWGERLGAVPAAVQPGGILVHAVSVGEVQAAVPIVRALQERFPQLPCTVTTITPAGSDRVRQLFGDRVQHQYLPYDLPFALRRFLAAYRPRLMLVMETELWPNLFAQCRRRSIPILLANARLSAKAYRGYRWIVPLIRRALEHTHTIAAQSDKDARHFIALGAERTKVVVTANVKFDVPIPADARRKAAQLRARLGGGAPVWIAGSTHPGEEAMVLDARAQLAARVPGQVLILAPRHPERAERIEAMCRERGIVVVRRTQLDCALPPGAVLLLDTVGELPWAYGAADAAFVGGSLVPHGGHNPVEPAALDVPVITGPHVFNFDGVYQELFEQGAAQLVWNAEELADALARWLADPAARAEASRHARAAVERSRGAVGQIVARVAEVLGAPSGPLPQAGEGDLS